MKEKCSVARFCRLFQAFALKQHWCFPEYHAFLWICLQCFLQFFFFLIVALIFLKLCSALICNWMRTLGGNARTTKRWLAARETLKPGNWPASTDNGRTSKATFPATTAPSRLQVRQRLMVSPLAPEAFGAASEGAQSPDSSVGCFSYCLLLFPL